MTKSTIIQKLTLALQVRYVMKWRGSQKWASTCWVVNDTEEAEVIFYGFRERLLNDPIIGQLTLEKVLRYKKNYEGILSRNVDGRIEPQKLWELYSNGLKPTSFNKQDYAKDKPC